MAEPYGHRLVNSHASEVAKIDLGHLTMIITSEDIVFRDFDDEITRVNAAVFAPLFILTPFTPHFSKIDVIAIHMDPTFRCFTYSSCHPTLPHDACISPSSHAPHKQISAPNLDS